MTPTVIAPPDSTASVWLLTSDGVKTTIAVLGFLLGSGVLTKVIGSLLSKWRERRQHKRLIDRLPIGDFHPEAVKSALRYYIEHEVSAIDPAGREMDRANLGPREPLFRILDRTIYDTHEKSYLLLLADSGMGKTTALLNYYAHNSKRKRSRPIVIFSLRAHGTTEKIALVQDKPSTILLLDALDEDPGAISNHSARVHELLKSAEDFRAVIISCRSQFFLSSEEITKETGVARLHHRGLGETAEYVLQKFYLCPFSPTQISAFLTKRYPFPRLAARRRARVALDHVQDLTIRPMLLAYLDDLARSGKSFTKISDAYEEIVIQWIRREKPLVDDSSSLLQFSEKLAVDLYIRRGDRGGEQARATEIAGLADEWGIPLERWQLTGRSLLTRDAADQFRFAHRSILEYLFVRSFFEGDVRCATVEWTDQMHRFAGEIADDAKRVGEDRGSAEIANKLLHASKSVDVHPSLTWTFCQQAILNLAMKGVLAYRLNLMDSFSEDIKPLVRNHVWPLLNFALTGSSRDVVQFGVVYNAQIGRVKHVVVARSANSQQDWLRFSISELPRLQQNARGDVIEKERPAVYVENQMSTIFAVFSADETKAAMYLFIQFPENEVSEAACEKTLDLLRSISGSYSIIAKALGSPGILRLLSERLTP